MAVNSRAFASAALQTYVSSPLLIYKLADGHQTQPDIPRDSRARSRSPGPRRGYGGDYRDGRPPRGGGYSPRRDGYRDRSPPPPRRYDDDYDRGRYRSPPRTRAPIDDYPPPRRGGGFDDPYRRDYPPADPYVNGRPPPRDYPPRDYPPRDAGYADYDRRARYW